MHLKGLSVECTCRTWLLRWSGLKEAKRKNNEPSQTINNVEPVCFPQGRRLPSDHEECLRGRPFVPREGLGAVRTDVRFLHAALVRAHVVAHPVLPLEALLADGAGVGLLVRVGQPVAVEVVDVPEGLPAGLAGVVLPHLVGVGAGVGVGVLRSSRRSGDRTAKRYTSEMVTL